MSERKKAEKGFKKLGKRTALLYAGLVIALCAAFAVAKNAAAFRLTPKAADETQTAAPSAEFDVSDLAPYTQSAETTAAPTESAPTETQPDEQAVVAQEDGITRAEHFSLPLLSEVDKPFSGGDMVQSKTMGDWRVHNGVDFRGTVGDQVRAVNNGVVKAVYDDVLWGTVVEIDHGDGLVARYCGLGKGSTAAVGDKVKINDRIGNLGSIPVESADEVHLHFEMRQDGTAVDPMPILQS
ncbi:MAG: M23 family metallopeptidase, partial [Clostridia bacterium]|nr:M23 family metallopeptidase [Clostridia bacterium]